MSRSQLLLLFAAAIVSTCCGLRSTSAQPAVALEQPIPIPANPDINAKHLRITLHMQERSITVEAISMDYGRARSYIGDPDQFRAKLFGFSGKVLGEIRTWDPRALAVYQANSDGTFTDPFSLKQETEGDFFVPFIDSLTYIELTDRWNNSYARIDLVNAIQAFCTANQFDSECSAWLKNFIQGSTP
jgi:hypothetical protein